MHTRGRETHLKRLTKTIAAKTFLDGEKIKSECFSVDNEQVEDVEREAEDVEPGRDPKRVSPEANQRLFSKTSTTVKAAGEVPTTPINYGNVGASPSIR